MNVPPGIRWIHRAGLAIGVGETYNCGTVEVERFGDLELAKTDLPLLQGVPDLLSDCNG